MGGINSPELLSFLQAIFVWDPKTRMTPDQALRHPFITGLPLSSSSGTSTPVISERRVHYHCSLMFSAQHRISFHVHHNRARSHQRVVMLR
jgi:serine/threonine protein kinase